MFPVMCSRNITSKMTGCVQIPSSVAGFVQDKDEPLVSRRPVFNALEDFTAKRAL